jgi:predicted TIM-barrel fold metal-dependent hydrolase
MLIENLRLVSSFYGNEFPTREKVLQQRNNIIEAFPDVTFIGAHFGFQASDLASVGELLDKYPNYYVDTSAEIHTLGQQPYSSRRFFLKYQDRILFGTDFPPSVTANRQIFRFFETDDEYFNFKIGKGAIYGIYLPDGVLRKIYYENAKKILKV